MASRLRRADGARQGRITVRCFGGPRTASVTAVQPIDALIIDRQGFSRLMNEFPVIRFDLVNALTQRLRERRPEPLD
jgi:CRP-like cAMP-binding protein